MRATLIFLVIVLAMAGGYFYTRSPAGCAKLVADLGAISKAGLDKFRADLGPALSASSETSSTTNDAPVSSAIDSTPSTPAPAVAPAPAPKPVVIFAPPPKVWTPPDVIPAQPNWTWTTSDGTTYQNVVVTKIGPETVSITHSLGVAHDIPISNLSPDVQKMLNYDPVAASAARAERRREDAHPYYPLAQSADALDVARQMQWPVAWIDSFASFLTIANPIPDSEEDFTLRAIDISKTHAIVIFADGAGDLVKLPPLVHAQMIIMDDGPSLPDGHHFYAPKIIVTSSDGGTALVRVSYTQMKAGGNAAIEQAYASLTSNPTPATNAPSANSPAGP